MSNETKRKAGDLLNMFSAPAVLVVVMVGVWNLRPYFDKIDAHDRALNSTAVALQSLDSLAADLKRRVEKLENH